MKDSRATGTVKSHFPWGLCRLLANIYFEHESQHCAALSSHLQQQQSDRKPELPTPAAAEVEAGEAPLSASASCCEQMSLPGPA